MPSRSLGAQQRMGGHGPFDNTDELNRVKADLARKGFDVAVIRYQG